MALTFFPVEDANELEKLRKLRSPFMVNISKCFQTGTFKDVDKMFDKIISRLNEKCHISYEIVKTASPDINPELKARLKHVIMQNESNTLKLEHEALGQFNMR